MKRLVASFVVALTLVGGCAASLGASAPTLPGEHPPNVEKLDMPENFPAVLTFCSHGTRVWYSFGPKDGYSGTTVALTSQRDGQCG